MIVLLVLLIVTLVILFYVAKPIKP